MIQKLKKAEEELVEIKKNLDEKNKLCLSQKHQIEDFTIEGSIIGHDVEQVRKTITSLNLRDKREISPTYEMKRLKRLVKASRNHL